MQKGTKCASKDYLGSKYASKGLLASHTLLLTVVNCLKPPQSTDFSRDFDNQHGDPDVMKRKLPRWFLAAAWAVSRRAPLLCWRRLFRCWRWPLSCWRRLAVLAPAFFPAAAALSFVVARRRRTRFGVPNGLGPPTTLYLPESAHRDACEWLGTL